MKHCIRLVFPNGKSVVLAGKIDTPGYDSVEIVGASAARFQFPTGVCVDPTNDRVFMVVDKFNHCVRRLCLPGIAKTAQTTFLLISC